MNYQTLIPKFEAQLEAMESCTDDILYKAETGIAITEKCIKKVRKEIIKFGFESTQKEICFFKYLKPQILSKLIYYAKLFNIESKRPRTSSKFQLKYLNSHIHKLQVFFNDNLEFYHYYRRGATTLDDLYFLRGNSDLRTTTDTFNFYIDEKFSTCQDANVATIIAYDLLIVYLQQEIEKLESNKNNQKKFFKNKTSKLFWTGSKTELTELIYALQSCGAINSGTADIKELATFLEKSFKIDLGNYYHTFIEIRARKGSRTKFINRLEDALLKRFEESDI